MRILFLFSLLFLYTAFSFGQVTSDFNDNIINVDGWTAPNALIGVINYSVTGGNPGGLVSATDVNLVTGAPIYWYFQAPAKFLGNVCSAYNRNITFDLRQGVVRALVPQADVIISNGTLALYYFSISPTPTTAWTHYIVALNELSGDWKTSNSSTGTVASKAEIKSVLCDLTSLQIRGRFGAAPLSIGSLDNVILERSGSLISPPK